MPTRKRPTRGRLRGQRRLPPLALAELPVAVTRLGPPARRPRWQAMVTLGPDDVLCVDGPTPAAAEHALRAVLPLALAARALLPPGTGRAPAPLQ